MHNSKIEAVAEVTGDNSLRAAAAIGALSAVRYLCTEAGACQPGEGLHHVNADDLACLLTLITNELWAVHDRMGAKS